MRRLVLCLSLLLFTGCVGTYIIKEALQKNVDVLEIKVKKVKFPTLVSYMDAIEFLKGERLFENQYEGFYYEEQKEKGIHFLNPSKFYKDNFKHIEKLENKLDFLKGTRLLRHLQKGALSKDQKKLKSILRNLNPIDSGRELNIYDLTKELENQFENGDKGVAEELVFLYQSQGAYEDAAKFLEECPDCLEMITLAIKGVVLDETGKGISQAKLELFNTNKIIQADGAGKFLVTATVPKISTIRLRAWKPGYSDDYQKVYVVSDQDSQLYSRNFKLTPAHHSVKLDLQSKSFDIQEQGLIISKKNDVLTVKGPLNSYEIGKGVLVDKDQQVYEGEVHISLFNFDRSSEENSLLELDMLTGETLVLDGVMTTYGMPYLQIFDVYGKELLIHKDNPAKITVEIAEKDLIWNGDAQKGIPPTSREKIKELIEYSKDHDVTRAYLEENGMHDFPMWWVLDRGKGMWDEVPYRNLTEDLRFDTIFYSFSS